MPMFASVSFAPYEAMLSNIVTTLKDATNRIAELKGDIAKLQTSENIPADRDTVVDSVNTLMEVFNEDLGTAFNQAGQFSRDVFSTIFEGYADDNYPVTRDGMAKVHDALPSDRLEQFRYMNLHDFAAHVHECAALSDLISLDPRADMYASPEDMYAESVLTRTTIYLQELHAADDQDEWVRSAVAVIGELSETVGLLCNALYEIKDALQSDEFGQLAIQSIDDNQCDDAIHSTIDKMNETIESVSRFCDHAKALIEKFYIDGVIPCMSDTQTAIQAAYKIYINSNMITF